MSRMKQQLLSFAANRLSTGNLIRYSRSTLIFPFYHTVSDHYLPHIHPLYTPKTSSEFIKDLDFLLKYFQPVSMEDVYAHVCKNKIISRPSFHLSFDDGLKEVCNTAFPILQQKGIPFTVFVNSAFIDNRDLFYRYKTALIMSKLAESKQARQIKAEEIRAITYQQKDQLDILAKTLEIDFNDFLKQQSPYLSKDEVKEMQKKGVTIGAHSIDHPLFAELHKKEQIRQIIESSAYVKENFGEPHSYFAFPFTDTGISDHVFSEIYDQVDLTFGISGIYFQQKGRHIGRIDMEKYGRNAAECVNKACLVHLLKHNF